VATKCSRCGGHVTEQFARVFGNNDDEVEGCTDCTPASDLMDGDAAGLDSKERGVYGGIGA
jgi:hypothetical protein